MGHGRLKGVNHCFAKRTWTDLCEAADIKSTQLPSHQVHCFVCAVYKPQLVLGGQGNLDGRFSGKECTGLQPGTSDHLDLKLKPFITVWFHKVYHPRSPWVQKRIGSLVNVVNWIIWYRMLMLVNFWGIEPIQVDMALSLIRWIIYSDSKEHWSWMVAFLIQRFPNYWNTKHKTPQIKP